MATLQSLQDESGFLSFCSDTSPDVDHENTTAPSSLGLEAQDSVYSDLPNRHIRLLRLESGLTATGEHSPMLRCKISVFPLEAPPKFVAVSYCWGDASISYPLICSGHELRIHQSLYDLLQQLSQVKCKDWLWIDAICINQTDDAEKNHQIPMMRDIYSQAELVLAWFGPTQDDLAAVWPFIQIFPNVLRSFRYVNGVAELEWPEDQQPPSDFLEMLIRFIDVPFLSRLWVVQEIALAKQVLVLSGSFVVTWGDLYTVAKEMLRQLDFLRQPLGSRAEQNSILSRLFDIVIIGDARVKLQGNNEPSGWDLLTLSKTHHVSNLQDKVYALLGLLGSSTWENLVVDVDKPVEEVYLDFSAFLFDTAQYPGNFLYMAGSSNFVIAGLPSWCFDLSVNHYARYVRGASASSGDPTIVRRIIGTGHNICKPKFEASVQEKTLQFLGWEVDHVMEVIEFPNTVGMTSLFDVQNLDLKVATDLCRWEDSCLQISKEVYSTPEAFLDAHWRTLTGTCNSVDRSHEYRAWKEYLASSCQRLTEDDPTLLSRQPSRWRKFSSHLFRAIRGKHEPSPRCPEIESTSEGVLSLTLSSFHRDAILSSRASCFYSTTSGRVGMGPPGMRPGDRLCLPFGAPMFHVMRKNELRGRYTLIGSVYLAGMMNCEIYALGAEKLKEMERRFVVE